MPPSELQPQIAPDVSAQLDRHPPRVRDRLLALRALIFRAAGKTDGVGDLQETLKWGQPAYLPAKPHVGTTIRIDADETNGGDVALYVHCQTDLVDEWRNRYPTLTFGGNRSVHFSASVDLPQDELEHMIAMALTYHLRKHLKPT